MLPKLFAFACFLLCANCFAQQYPFVHYTPKDGLISNQVKNIYQDSRGRIYFSTFNGLSVYNGSRFNNYNTKNGLPYDIVNCTIEMGDDSVWIVTNTSSIYCLVKGKLNPLILKDSVPVINSIYKDENGKIYAATEQGLYFFDKDRFIKLPFSDTRGKNINFYLENLVIAGNYILIQRDHSLLREKNSKIYLYNKITKKVTDEMDNISSIAQSPDRQIWVSTPQRIMTIDDNKLKNGNIVLNELPATFDKIKQLGNYFVSFDNESTCWLGNQNNVLIRASSDGKITTFTKASGLDFLYINHIFTDKEGTVWIATNNAGIYKLIRNNFSIVENISGTTAISSISFSKEKNHLLFLSSKMNKLLITKNNSVVANINCINCNGIEQVFETLYGLYGVGKNFIYKLERNMDIVHPKIIYTDTIDQEYIGSLIDKNGNLFVCGRNKIIGVIKKQNDELLSNDNIYIKNLNAFADHLALDGKGNIWAATRSNELLKYETHPEDPSNYLEQKINFKDIYPGISPRSITIDNNNNIWIGTRIDGIHIFKIKGDSIDHLAHLSDEEGLSDKFITQLVCDQDNNIWAASPSGLDKIIYKGNKFIIENITKQNNIYQRVFKIVVDNKNDIWGLLSNGTIKIPGTTKKPPEYSPTVSINCVKAGKDAIERSNQSTFSYQQNSLNFSFAATSFLNEKQILYSYRLRGGSNDQWSEPSNTTSVSFIDLPSGKYVLDVKAIFPAGRYADQIANYKFSIIPPWWKTWWFTLGIGILGIGILILIVRFFYRRRLEKQLALLEKQQAVEKERTRIATDMHDDLGAGLSRIKFLSETIGIKKQKQQPIEEDISKIREYSHEMIDKMGEIVWALNEKNDSLSDLLSYTRVYAMEYLSQNGITCIVEAPDQFSSGFVSGEFRRNVYLTVKEALHNVVKHAQASSVIIKMQTNGKLEISIHDNGIGFDTNKIRSFSNGLTSMKNRITELKGSFDIENENGIIIKIAVPLRI